MKKIAMILMLVLALAYSCETEEIFFEIAEITGSWNVEETSTEYGAQNYQVTISADPVDNNKVLISNFFDLGETIYGITNTDFAINIPQQTVDGYTISGQGIVDNKYGSIEWTYSVSEGGSAAHEVTATFTPAGVATTNDTLTEK